MLHQTRFFLLPSLALLAVACAHAVENTPGYEAPGGAAGAAGAAAGAAGQGGAGAGGSAGAGQGGSPAGAAGVAGQGGAAGKAGGAGQGGAQGGSAGQGGDPFGGNGGSSAGGGSSSFPGLIFSEYIEGSSSNKALELWNGNESGSVDLSNCVIERYSNGSSAPAEIDLSSAGKLAAGEVYSLCDPSSSIPKSKCSQSLALDFNGNDALVLVCSGKVLDSIGQKGKDPGSAWGTGQITTKDSSLRRKCSVTSGDTSPSDSYDPAEEWGDQGLDVFDDLGVAGCEP